jgi:Zn finger protein HypA/HybF involved in hydrogenase expression
MHEMGVATEICRIAEHKVGTAMAPNLRRVAVVVGSDAGVEPSSLGFCLDALLAQPPFGGASSEIALVPGDALHVDYLEVDDGSSSD